MDAVKLQQQETQQALLAAIVNSSEDAIVSKDLNGIVTSWNKAAERIYGWKAEDIIGKSKALVIPPELPNELAAILDTIKTGGRIEHYETRRVRKDGRMIEVAISVSPVHDREGSVIGAATIVRDITERKQIERELQQKHQEVEALNERLKRGMSETHHRVKNNLQVIAAMIEMQAIQHQVEKTVSIEVYRQLKTHIHTLAIVHDLLSANIKENEEDQRVSVRAVLKQMLPMLERTAYDKTVRFFIDDAQLTAKMCVSLALILNELVSNAFKHGNQETDILFRADEMKAQLIVADDGSGFPPNFDPVHSARAGLELVESLVRADLRGKTTYINRSEGGGCVIVTFCLPPNETETL